MRSESWEDVPVLERRAVFLAATVLTYGAVVHVVHLVVGGLNPYPAVPGWLAVYFVSLTVLDPAAAVLLLLRRRAGLVLCCAALVTDAAANVYANYALQGSAAGRIGQAVITVLALAVLAAAPRLWIWLHPTPLLR